MTTHSPAGGSSADRVIACPASVALIAALPFSEDEDECAGEGENFAARGTAAHHAAAVAWEQGLDAWEVADEEHVGVLLDNEDVRAIQSYLDLIKGRGQVEKAFAHPEVHPWLYGTIDHHEIIGDLLDLTDYKHGVGVQKDPERLPQLMYYCYLVMLSHPEITHAGLRIVQPRGFHPDGPVRPWETTREEIFEWAHSVLLPRMIEAENGSQEFHAGEHCRFCPAKLYCAVAGRAFKDIADTPLEMSELSDEELEARAAGIPIALMVIKALKLELSTRIKKGRTFTDWKAVNQKADRIWNELAEAAAQEQFGADAITKPKLKSPAQIEALPGGKEFTKQYAFAPVTGTTIAHRSDKRKEIIVTPMAEAFAKSSIARRA